MLDLFLFDVGRQPAWELARQARVGIQRQIASGFWASAWYLLNFVLQRQWRVSVQPTLCGISSLGVIAPPPQPTVPITAMSWTVNQQGVSNNLRLSCATVGGALNLTLRSPWHTAEEVDELLEGVIEQLQKMLSESSRS